MTQVRLIKDALEKSYTTFKRNLPALRKAIERESSSARTLKVKLDSLTEALDTCFSFISITFISILRLRFPKN